jgi:glycerol-3-phosphate acyltransferase PlsX
VDSGANVDSKPEWLVQFALKGSLYAKEMFGISNPRVAILSNGEENKKGNVVSVQAAEQLAKLPINFIGNIEGRDL